MKTGKAWTAAILIFAMTLSLAGCTSREPTAEELLAGVPVIDSEKYYDMTVEMDVAAQADGQTSEISLSFGAEGCDDILHLYDMDLSLGVSGVNIAFSMEGWMESAEKKLYCHMTMFGEDSGWMLLSSASNSGVFPADAFREMTEGVGSLGKTGAERVLEPHTEGEDYVVTWTESEVDLDNFSGAFGNLMGALGAEVQASGAAQAAAGSATAQAHFDEETHELKFIRIEADAADSESSSAVCITIAFNASNGEQKLAIPQNIIDTAADVGGLA